MDLVFVDSEVFRETPQVTFFDAGIPGSNGSDIVIHHSSATSPPNIDWFEQYYVHRHQIDHNLVVKGRRTFTLLNPDWDQPHHIVILKREMGALQIPKNTFHRSTSGLAGSIVLNQAIRDKEFDAKKEFLPINLGDCQDLKVLKEVQPIIWYWDQGSIHKLENTYNISCDMEKYLISISES